jgi:hypothetical protein
MSDADGPGHDKSDEPGPVTKEEANRDFRKKSGESQQEFFLRCGGNLKKQLDAMGLPVDDPVASHGTTSVYLKGKGRDLQVRIADHAPKPGRKSETPAREHLLLIKGTGVSAKRLNDLLSEIAARHKR